MTLNMNIVEKFQNQLNIDLKINDSLSNLYSSFSQESYEKLKKDGFLILKNAVKTSTIVEIRDYWRGLNRKKVFHSDIVYGEENYTKDFFGKYTRYFDFYWNNPTHKLTRDLSLTLHMFRNLFLNEDPYNGLIINSSRNYIYQAVTHYPEGTGEMALHIDPNNFLPVHYNLPLTAIEDDYKIGGLYFIIEGEKQNIEQSINLGDLLLFNGAIPHGIEKIEGVGSKSNIGRMQLFGVPVTLQKKKYSLIYSITKNFYGRYKYLNYRLGFGFKHDNKNFR